MYHKRLRSANRMSVVLFYGNNGENFVGANEEAKRFDDVFEVGRIQTQPKE